MVVICPKCKTRLKVDETKLSPEGSRFKCPKCSTVLSVKRPVPQPKKSLNDAKILLAHSNAEVLKKAASLLSGAGFNVITSSEGIDAMIKALKELPSIALLEVALPKIYGFELCKKLKSRAETKEMKIILIASVYDKNKYKRQPASLYGADDYLDEPELESELVGKVNTLRTQGQEPVTPPPPEPQQPQAEVFRTAPKPDNTITQTVPNNDPGFSNEMVEKARRLARTIINDIYLYNPAKVDASIRDDNFYSVFASDVREGQKLYDSRIPGAVRTTGDYYREAIDNFLSARKKMIA